MSEILTSPAAAPSPGAPAPQAGEGASAWRVSGRGLLTVMTLELRQRVRSTRWITVLVVWAVVLGGLAALIRHAVFTDGLSTMDDVERNSRAGAEMFGWVVLLVLVLGSLVAPALSATSVNGDRSAGVLATLQATLLTPAEIAIGKLLAAWVTGLALLAVAAPFVLWAYVSGGTPGGRLVVVLALLAVMLLVVCAIGLGWSAITARTASSAVLTYLSVAFLGLGLPLLFGLLLPVVTTTQLMPVRTMAPVGGGQEGEDPLMRCVVEEQSQQVTRADRIWWLLAANPFVVIADAAPRPSELTAGDGGPNDVLSGVRSGVRELRLPPERVTDYCGPGDADYQARELRREQERERLGITWPYGLAADLGIAAGFTVVAVRRLRAPARRLPRGTRVA